MPPSPIHRSKTLWLGLIILLSLCWAWHSSMGWNHNMVWSGSKFAITASNTTGTISLHITTDSTGRGLSNSFFPPGLHTWKDPQEDHLPQLQPPLKFQSVDRPGQWREWTLALAHWLIILLFLIPWLTFLAWRWRRMKSHLVHPSPGA